MDSIVHFLLLLLGFSIVADQRPRRLCDCDRHRFQRMELQKRSSAVALLCVTGARTPIVGVRSKRSRRAGRIFGCGSEITKKETKNLTTDRLELPTLALLVQCSNQTELRGHCDSGADVCKQYSECIVFAKFCLRNPV